MPQVVAPFSNGRGGGTRKADAMSLGAGSWRVFLYLAGGVRQVDVAAPTAERAISAAWDTLRRERAAKGVA